MDLKKLREPFLPSDIEWRIGQAGKKKDGEIWAKVLAYVTNRAIQNRLDEVCEPQNWCNEYKPGPGGGIVCGISIWFGDRWITKWDGAENTDIEAVKGGLSDSMKRAGVQWGIGRYLYELEEGWAEVSPQGARYANCKIKNEGKEEWINFKWTPPRLPQWAVPHGEPVTIETTTAPEQKHTETQPTGEAKPMPRTAPGWVNHLKTKLVTCGTVEQLEQVEAEADKLLTEGRISKTHREDIGANLMRCAERIGATAGSSYNPENK